MPSEITNPPPPRGPGSNSSSSSGKKDNNNNNNNNNEEEEEEEGNESSSALNNNKINTDSEIKESKSSKALYRRIDIKVYPRSMYAFALLYFTGSDHFNRSMRWYAHYLKIGHHVGHKLSDDGLFPCQVSVCLCLSMSVYVYVCLCLSMSILCLCLWFKVLGAITLSILLTSYVMHSGSLNRQL